jgi:hypothetical protein
VVRHERERGPRALTGGAEPGVWRDRDEARECRRVADIVGKGHQPVPGRGFGTRNRGRVWIASLCRLARGVRGRRGRDEPSVGEGVEELPALVERARVRPDEADLGQRDVSGSDERVSDRENRLGDDRERALVQKVMGLRHRSGERALDRQHPVRGNCVRNGFGDASKAARRHALGGREHHCRGGIRVRALGPWVDNGVLHRFAHPGVREHFSGAAHRDRATVSGAPLQAGPTRRAGTARP